MGLGDGSGAGLQVGAGYRQLKARVVAMWQWQCGIPFLTSFLVVPNSELWGSVERSVVQCNAQHTHLTRAC